MSDELGRPGLPGPHVAQQAGPGRRGTPGPGRGGRAAAASGGLATDSSDAGGGLHGGSVRAGRDGDPVALGFGHPGDRSMGHPVGGFLPAFAQWEPDMMGIDLHGGDAMGAMRGSLQPMSPMQMQPGGGGGRRGGGMQQQQQMQPSMLTHGSMAGGGGVAGYSGAGSAEHGDEHPGGEVVDGAIRHSGGCSDRQGGDGDVDADADGDPDVDGAAEDSWVPGGGGPGGGGRRRTTEDGEAHQRRPRRKIAVRRIKGRAGAAHRRESNGGGGGGAGGDGAASAGSGDELQIGTAA
jgi:hypothetical protein